MASFDQFDTVKAEKADAMRRYRRQRIITLCINLAVTLALVIWCFFPFSLLNHQFLIFGLINTLVFLIYNFSNSSYNLQNDAVPNHDRDLYDQYISFSSSSRRKTSSEVEKDTQLVVSPAPEITCSDKQIIHYENATNVNPAEESVVEVKEEKCFTRTNSEKYAAEEKTKKRSRQRRILRRSESEVTGKELVVVVDAGDGRHRKAIKDMNSEEFRLTIERFIASKKKNLRDENFVVLMEEEDK